MASVVALGRRVSGAGSRTAGAVLTLAPTPRNGIFAVALIRDAAGAAGGQAGALAPKRKNGKRAVGLIRARVGVAADRAATLVPTTKSLASGVGLVRVAAGAAGVVDTTAATGTAGAVLGQIRKNCATGRSRTWSMSSSG